jgi:hypothetical protein
MNEISIRTVTGWFTDPDQKRCVARKWLNTVTYQEKPQFSKRWAKTLEAFEFLQDYESVYRILDDFVAEVSAAAANAAKGTGADQGGAAGPPSGSSEGASSSAPPALSAGDSEGGVTSRGGLAGPPSGSGAGASSAATLGPPSGSSEGASSAATPPVHYQAPAQAHAPLPLLMAPVGQRVRDFRQIYVIFCSVITRERAGPLNRRHWRPGRCWE